MVPLLTIANIPVWENADKSLSWLGGFAIDGDGTGGNSYHDPCFQNDTSLHYNGAALNAEQEKFGVVPPQIIKAVPGVVMGCKGCATNIRNGRFQFFVVADEGPADKISEGSIALAESLGIPSSPVSGGTTDHVIAWQIWPGVPAECNGRLYALHSSG